MWGTAFGLAGRAGLHGQKAVAAVFATVYTGNLLLNTALGLYQPSSWSGRELAIDVIDKLVQAEATGAIFDRMTATSCLGGWHRSSAVTRSRRAASALGRRAIKLHQPEAE
jgi:hypothetical protein